MNKIYKLMNICKNKTIINFEEIATARFHR